MATFSQVDTTTYFLISKKRMNKTIITVVMNSDGDENRSIYLNN